MREGVSESDNWERYDPNGFEILTENQKDLDAEIELSKKTAGGASVKYYKSDEF